MAESKHQLFVTIGAALSSGFSSAISKSTSKIKEVGSAIKNLDKNSVQTGKSLENFHRRQEMLLSSMNRQQQILNKRNFYHSQILGMVALGASLAVPIRAAMKFEDSLAQIKQVVNFPTPDGLKKLGDELSKISETVPVTADELASIAAIGGSFGVPLKELTFFSKEVGKTAIAWRANISETAERVGNMMKVFNVSTSELPQYFDAINELGNKTGASADKILQGLNRASDGMANFKLALPNASALVSTIISFGESAETAGSKVATMLQRLSIAPKLGASTQKALHSIGMSSVTLPKMINENPEKALDKILTQLSKLNPEKRSTTMYSIFGRGASAMVGKLVDNLDLYRKNLKIISEASSFKGSRNGDYEIVLGETNSQISLLKNNASSFSRELGFSLLPNLKKIIGGINQVLIPVNNWIRKNPELTSTIHNVVAGLALFRLSTFVIGYASTFLFGGLNKLSMGFTGLRLAMSSIFSTMVFGWFGKLALVVGLVSLAFAGLSENANGELNFSFDTLGNNLKSFYDDLKQQTKPFIEKAKGIFSGIWDDISKNLSPETRATLEKFGITFSEFGGKLKQTGTQLGNQFFSGFDDVFGNPQNVMGDVGKNFQNIFAIAQNQSQENSFPFFDSVLEKKDEVSKAISQFQYGVEDTSQTLDSRLSSSMEKLNQNSTSNIQKVLRLATSLTVLGGGFFYITKAISSSSMWIFSLLGSGIGIVWDLFKGFTFLGIQIGSFVVHSIVSLMTAFWFCISVVFPKAITGLWWLGSRFSELARTYIPVAIRMVRAFAMSIWNLGQTFPLVAKIAKGAGWIAIIGFLIWSAYKIITDWEGVKKYWSDIWTNITNTCSNAWNSFKEKRDKFTGAIETLIDATINLGIFVVGILENINALFDKFVMGKDVVIPAWESVKNFFSSWWNEQLPDLEKFITELKELEFTQKIVKAWEGVKKLFQGLLNILTKVWEILTSPVKDVFGLFKKVFDPLKKFLGEDDKQENSLLNPSRKTETRLSKGLPSLQGINQEINRTQNNNFSIHIEGTSKDSAKDVADKVVREVTNIQRTYLYDTVPEVL